jgi:transposase
MKYEDGTRLERFRQMKDEIRGSEEHLIVGIDVAKENHQAFFGTALGQTLLKSLVFGNDAEGFAKLLLKTEAMQERHGLDKVVFVLEPTSTYHKPLGEYLIKDGQEVVLVSGEVAKQNRKTLDGRWDKHDTKCSANAADLGSQGKVMYYEYPEKRMRELRSYLSLQRRLKKQEQSCRMRIRNHLVSQYFPELDPYMEVSEGLKVMKWSPSPSGILEMGYEAFSGLIAPGVQGMRVEHRLREIYERAGQTIGCESGEALYFESRHLVEELEEVREAMEDCKAKIQKICVQFEEYRYLLSIPGFGRDISPKVLGGIGDPIRFNSEKQLLKLAGLDLCAERSGKRSMSARPVISKKGKSEMRYALFQAALVASSRNREFKIWYQEQLRGREKEKGIGTKLRVKLAAKLLRIAWTLMKKKAFYDPEYLKV